MLPERFIESQIQPYESKNTTPISRVKVTHSPNSVKSLGLTRHRYRLDNSSEPDFSGETNLTKLDGPHVDSLIAFYSDHGAMSGLTIIDNFAVKWTGFIYTELNGSPTTLSFKTCGFGNIKLKIGSTWVIGSAGAYATLDQYSYNTGNYTVNDTWEAIEIYYYVTTGEAGMCVLYSDDININTFYPLSAGILSTTNSFLSTSTLSYVTRTSSITTNKDVDEFTFDIPILTSSDTQGYRYDRNLDRYIDLNDSSKYLEKFDLIEYECGYREDDNSDKYIKKFVGHIKNFSLRRINKGNDVITVQCEGFGSFLKNTLNLNYPNKLDYWMMEFSGPDSNNKDWNEARPDAVDYVPSYDNWPLHVAFKDLMIRGGIDPTLFHTKQKFLDVNDTQVNGNYLVEESNPLVVLERARLYGNPATVFFFEDPDDEYRLKSNFGDTIFDYIEKMIDQYGWDWGFHSYYDGSPYLRVRNNPVEIRASDSSDITRSGAGWTAKLTNLDVISGTYRETAAVDDYVESTFTAQRLDLVSTLYNTNGGIQASVASGISTTVVKFEDFEGDSQFYVNNRLLFEMAEGNENSVVQSVDGGNQFTISPALSAAPVSGTLTRTTVAKAEIRRGTTWATATPITTTYVPSYYNHGLDKVIPKDYFGKLYRIYVVSGTKRMFYHGFDNKSAVNPCIFNLATNLTRDDHMVRLTRLSDAEATAGALLGFNAFFIYDKDRNLPVYTFRTGDSVVSGTVVELSVKNSGSDLRNDCIVVGRRLGAVVPGNFSDNPINPNNPTWEHITSRAVDVNSIYDDTASNFTGRPLQSILIEPDIGSQDRADYWAVSFLNRYRFPGRDSTFQALGNPLMEIGDCIYVDDENKDTIDTSNKVWITSIESSWDQKKALDKYEVTSYPPWESYIPRTPVSLSDFEDKAVVDVRLTNQGTAESPYDPYTADSAGTFIEITFDLTVSGFLRASVHAHDGTLVADLLNPDAEAGQRGWIRETAGSNKKVTWDGVDQYGIWNQRNAGDNGTFDLDENMDPRNWYATEDKNLKNASNDNYGKFYLKFWVQAFDGTVYTVSTDDDSQFIFTERGEQISASVALDPDFNVNDMPTGTDVGFDDSSNNGNGVKITITDTTSAGDRPAQLRIEATPYIGGIRYNSALESDTLEEHFGPANENFSSITITREEFIKYNGEIANSYFYPTDHNYIFRAFDLITEFTPSDYYDEKYVAWYFSMKFFLTDKSGRTTLLQKATYWRGPNTKAQAEFKPFQFFSDYVTEGETTDDGGVDLGSTLYGIKIT